MMIMYDVTMFWRKLLFLVFVFSILYGLFIILWLTDENNYPGTWPDISVYYITVVVLQKWSILLVIAKLLIFYLMSMHTYIHIYMFIYIIYYLHVHIYIYTFLCCPFSFVSLLLLCSSFL